MAVSVTQFRQVLSRGSCLIRRSALKTASVSLQSNKTFHTDLLNNIHRTTICPSLTSQRLQSVIISHRSYAKYDGDEQHPILRETRQLGTLTIAIIEERVMKVLKAYDRISADKLTLESHFVNDIGLDSLDHVEVIMAMEDEFGFEIPDGDAEKLLRPKDIIQYVADHEDIYE